MIAEFLSELLIANLVAGAAILLVLALRRPVRRRFGARIAYALWLAVPLAGLAVFLPTPEFMTGAAPIQAVATYSEDILTREMMVMAPGAAAQGPRALDLAQLALALWLGGVLASMLRVAVEHRQGVASFGALSPATDDPRVLRASRPGLGPALIGALRPKLVLPSDFESRYNEAEQRLVLAHERRHLAAGDGLKNALATLIVCLNWFNPLAYVAAFFARIDQELACDAVVLAQHPGERRRYAQALMKTQLATAPLPLGCYWPGSLASLLKERVEALAAARPSLGRRALGFTAVLLIVGGAAYGAWAAHPTVRDLSRPTLTVEALPVVPVVTPDPPVLEARPAAAPVRAPAPATPEPAPERARPERARIEAAITAGDYADVFDLGGTARDVAQAMTARPGVDASRMIAPEFAQFVDTGGQLALTGATPRGGTQIMAPRDLAGRTAPAGSPSMELPWPPSPGPGRGGAVNFVPRPQAAAQPPAP